ncbi:MAG: hypothetical protein V2I33_24690 [Kangiellaceae bacterium]|nr:hypothetical protein [Kangiellaceae bacterium]
MATREKYSEEPPKPKPIHKPERQADEDHPLWLKDKGNTFFQAEDYESAINAYTQGIKADNKNIACLLNRSAAYLKQYELDNALADIETVEALPDLGDRAVAVCKVRRAAIAAWKGHYDEAIALYKEASYKLDSDEGIPDDIRRLEVRKQSQIVKEAGDKYFRGQ